jgi:hypothetical protein
MLKLKGEGLKNKNIFIESNSIFLSWYTERDTFLCILVQNVQPQSDHEKNVRQTEIEGSTQ